MCTACLKNKHEKMSNPIDNWLNQFGTTTANAVGNGIVGGIMGIASGAINDNRQYNQEERLQRLQIEGQKEMADYMHQKQMDLWHETNYKPQVDELKKAGLNPALLYGGGGGGGTTAAAISGNVGRANAPQGGGEIMGMQLMGAQAEVLKSQARLNNIEADKKAGIDTEVGKTQAELNNTQILSLTQGIKNQQAQELYTKSQTALNKIQLAFEQETYEDRVNAINHYEQLALHNANMASTEEYIKKQTQDDVIKTIKTNAVGAVLANELTKSQTNVNKEQIKKIQSDILVNNQQIKTQIETVSQNWKKLNQSQKQLEVDTILKGVESLYKGDNILGTTVQIHDREATRKQIENVLNKD